MQLIRSFIDMLGGMEYALFWGVYSCVLLLLLQALLKILSALFRLKVALRERKQRRLQARRRLEFTLPDGENAYLRERLRTSLKAEDKPPTDKESVGVRLRYARRMIARLKESPLSPVERLDIEEMSGLVAAYGGQQKWSNGDIKGVNEIFARLLKLSAKYEIAV